MSIGEVFSARSKAGALTQGKPVAALHRVLGPAVTEKHESTSPACPLRTVRSDARVRPSNLFLFTVSQGGRVECLPVTQGNRDGRPC